MNPTFTEEALGTWWSLCQHPLWATEFWRQERLPPHCAYDSSLTSLESAVISQSPSPGDSCHKSSLSPSPHPLPSPSARPPSHSRSLFTPLLALLTGPQVHPHPICGLSRSTCTASDDSLRTLPAPCILQDTSLLPPHRCLS